MAEVKVILYRADWCGHCNDFLPTWNKLKTAFDMMDIKYEEYEEHANPKAIEDANIRGFPTIVIVSNGKTEEYHKERDYDAIMKFINYKKNEALREQTGGSNNFYEKYLKYKRKYLNLKKKKQNNKNKK